MTTQQSTTAGTTATATSGPDTARTDTRRAPTDTGPDTAGTDTRRAPTDDPTDDPADDASFRRALRRSAALEQELATAPASHVVLSGDRPTGDLHLGHLLGTLANRVRLQQQGVPLILVIADYQVITDRDDVGPLRHRVRTLVADYLAAGVDPERTVIFPHSAVPALNQLLVPFLSLVSDAELRRNPTVKAEASATTRATSALLLTYPVHQAADILFCRGSVVPVGRDQLPHLEMARIIARRFNARYGETFRIPAALLSSVPSLLGTDGRKMAKSRGNAIALGASDDDTARLIGRTRTDSSRTIDYDPATRPEVSSLLAMIGALTDRPPHAVAAEIGTGGAGALKKLAVAVVNESLAPLRRRRRELLADPAYLDDVLIDGIAAAGAMAGDTLRRVRSAMRMEYLA